jgi:hypothetical protein
MKRFSLATFIVFSFIAIIQIVSTGCANIIPPSGGPRDSLPPKLMAATPKDSALNVATNKIVLTFDEFVDVKEITENLIVSPVPKTVPTIDYKLRNVTIKLRDSLEPNTTYSINFGNSIKDVNEGNVAKGFTYIFSTGNKIDNNTFSGKVIKAETGKVDTTLIVLLHNNLSDTAIKKLSPRYYAKLKNDGSFMFKNLPQGNFNVFVLPNEYGKRYDDTSKVFAFSDSVIHVSSNTKEITLYAYEQAKKKAVAPTAASPKPNATADKKLRYSVSLEGGRQDLLNNTLKLEFNRKIESFDATKIILTDTNYQTVKDYSIALDTSKKKLVLTKNWHEDEQFRLILQKDAIADSAGTTLTKADTLKFVTKREAEYGSVKLRFNNLDTTKNPVLQIIRNNEIVESVVLKQREFSRKLYVPGEYELRILFDTNKNGVWDAGNYALKKQPEIVKQLDKKLSIRANWDNENEINL